MKEDQGFRAAIRAARSDRLDLMARLFQSGAKKDWRAAREYLAIRDPKNWGKQRAQGHPRQTPGARPDNDPATNPEAYARAVDALLGFAKERDGLSGAPDSPSSPGESPTTEDES